MHVDTTWKFREMIVFREQMRKKYDFELLVYTNEEGVRQGISPFTHGTALYTDIMKTEGLKQALDKYKFDVAFGGARRDEEKSRAKERIFSFRTQIIAGIRSVNVQSSGTFITPGSIREKVSVLSRFPTGPSLTSGSTSTSKRFLSFLSTTPNLDRLLSATVC